MLNLQLEMRTINSVRAIGASAVTSAASGHPGIVLGGAPALYSLYTHHLKVTRLDPEYFNRDRFVMSAGHGSALLYSVLHLLGFNITAEDLINFRQFGSPTPGHPERDLPRGIEMSTGPLGQGVASAVGMAIAETMLAGRFNRPGFNVVDHYTYAFVGDGCLMEGVALESASLAGTLKLNKLIVIYDSNNITIEGGTDIAFTEDVALRHQAQGWFVQRVDDSHNLGALNAAIINAKKQGQKPSLIIVNSRIGFGSPYENTSKSHGSPMSAADLNTTLGNLGINYENPFFIPEDIKAYARHAHEYQDVQIIKEKERLALYKAKYPLEYEVLEKFLNNSYAREVDPFKFNLVNRAESTRKASSRVIGELAKAVPNLISGSADLFPSTMTEIAGGGDYSAVSRTGRNIHFGIREHAMSAIMNGISLHGGFTCMCSTFLVFADYMKASMRMSALMKLPVIYVLTHDSLAVGEDGATHQPIEQLVMLRTIPNFITYRPCDLTETLAGYTTALRGEKPVALVFTRQEVGSVLTSKNAVKGGYVVSGTDNDNIVIMASGSEVALACEAAGILKNSGIHARVVSMPSTNVFDKQSAAYRNSVLLNKDRSVMRIAVEAGNGDLWYKYIGDGGIVIARDEFGVSGKGDLLMAKSGFTAQNIVRAAMKLVK